MGRSRFFGVLAGALTLERFWSSRLAFATATIVVTILCVINPAFATTFTLVADSFILTTPENTPVTASLLSEVMTGGDPGPFTFSFALPDPLHGVPTIAGNSFFTYSPGSNFVGTDMVGYEFSDGTTASNVAVITIDVGTTPLPAALPLFATGLSALGLIGWRRKRKSAGTTAAA